MLPVIFGIVCLVAGAVLALIGSLRSAQRVKQAHGDVNPYSVKMSEGTGVVPWWLSLAVLIGYTAIVIGAIVLIASVVA